MKIYITSGFLGAGKTTYIKKLIHTLSGKTVLIENEFGEINVDSKTFHDSLIIKEITSGCICCSMNGEFRKSILEIHKKFDPDYLIIEPSGIALLSELKNICLDICEDIADVEMGHTVTLVDVTSYFDYRESFGHFFNDQLMNADAIVLTHTKDNNAKEAIQKLYDIPVISESWLSMTTKEFGDVLDGIQVKGTQNNLSNTKKSIDFKSMSIHNVRMFNEELIRELRSDMNETHLGKLLRVKGIVLFDNTSFYEINLSPSHCSVTATTCRDVGLVFIGETLEEKRINQAYATFLGQVERNV